ncbi:MAG: hypothetical protein N2595_06555, partial [bacterium]|nr:hypothetical protein [bacterium]
MKTARWMAGIIVMLAALPVLSVNVDYYWSGNGVSQGGSGTWDTSNPHWGTAATGPFTIVWTNAVHGQD